MILIWTDTLLNTLCLSPCPPNSMLACATDIPTCEIYSGRTHPHSCESKHISTLKSGGRGGRVAVRHLDIYSIRLAKFLPSPVAI